MLPRVLICDDDPIMANILTDFCQKIGGVEIIGTVNTGKEVLELVQKESPHIILLDIELPDISGIEIARQLTENNPFLKIVFITGHNKYYPAAFQTYAYDYINKISISNRLPRTLKRIKEELKLLNNKKDEERLCINLGERDYFIYLDESFYSCHRSYIINLQKVKMFEREKGNKIIMNNGEEIPVSRRRCGEMRKIMDGYIMNK